MRSLIQTLLTATVIFVLFWLMFQQTNRASRLELEKETSETENRVKQQELEQRISLQEQLIAQEKQRVQQDSMELCINKCYNLVMKITRFLQFLI